MATKFVTVLRDSRNGRFLSKKKAKKRSKATWEKQKIRQATPSTKSAKTTKRASG